MATPLFCCGFECGNSNYHWNTNSAIVTTTFRTDTRAFEVALSAASNSWSTTNAFLTSATTKVTRIYLRFSTVPNADTMVYWFNYNGSLAGVGFKQADSKLYAAVELSGTITFGSTGAAATTGVWYLLDVKTVGSLTAGTSDVSVDTVALGQASGAFAGTTASVVNIGSSKSITGTYYFDDLVLSHTAADFPFGAGLVKSYIPNADGTHNVAGANDFERSLTGTDITNSTTDAWQLIDEKPLPTTEVDFINGVAPPNSTDYVEWQYEDSVEAEAPRAVEAVLVVHDAGGAGTNNYTVTLREHAGGTSANIFSGTQNVGSTITYRRAHFATVPGTSDAWTTTKFNALRSRFLVSDHSPDPYIDAAMLEAEFPEPAAVDASKPWRRTAHVPGQRYVTPGTIFGRAW